MCVSRVTVSLKSYKYSKSGTKKSAPRETHSRLEIYKLGPGCYAYEFQIQTLK